MQRRIPGQPHDQAVQPGDDDVGADAFEPVHAAEKAQGRRRVGIAECHGIDGQCRPLRREPGGYPDVALPCPAAR